MPKKTFFNLDKKKREKFVKACLEEFSSHDYNSASVSLIVKELEIAKGSVYQYFENKKDLFYYLVDISSEEKLKMLSEVNSEKHKNFSGWFTADLKAKATFEKDKGLYARLLDNFYLQKNNPDLKDKYIKIRHKEYSLYLDNLKKFSSMFKKKTDLDKTAMLLMKLGDFASDFPEISTGKKVAAKSKTSAAEEVAEGFLEMLKRGISKDGK